MDQKEQRRLLVDRFVAGEDVDISRLSPPLRERLQQERADREARHAAYEGKQVKAGELREAELRTAFLAAGGSSADWERERAAIIAADRQQRTLQGTGTRQALVNLKAVIWESMSCQAD